MLPRLRMAKTTLRRRCSGLWRGIFTPYAFPARRRPFWMKQKAKDIIDYNQHNQGLAVCATVEQIAVDPPIPVVSGLISSFDKVTSCRHRRSEDLTAFFSRFRDLAADHRMHGGLSAPFQVDEVLAIKLFNNASLSKETLTNEKNQLIALSQVHEHGTIDSKQEISKKFITDIEESSSGLEI